jgi:mycothiol maleylpyruvate isomerase-like protein
LTIAEVYLDAAANAADLIASAEVAASWNEPSALAEFAVSGLTGHLARQVITVPGLLRREVPPDPEIIGILDHYARVPWLDAALDDEANVAVRRSSEAAAADGHEVLATRVAQTIGELTTTLADEDLARLVYLPWTGWALTLADFLASRLLEIVIHVDDLAVSVGVEPAMDVVAQDTVLVLLTRLAARRHGTAAVLRALSRKERAPATITAF